MDTKTGTIVQCESDIFLLTDSDQYFLRRRYGDEYSNTVWESLIGKSIRVMGSIEPKEWDLNFVYKTFVVDSWEFAG